MFYGTDMFYILFRLHHCLFERILSAKVNARKEEEKWRALHHDKPPDLYAKFLEVLYNLLDGQIDNVRFQDECRAAIGTHSFVLFTIDKLIYKLVKQLQLCANDELGCKLLQLQAYESAKGAEGFVDIVYHANACALVHDDTLYRFEMHSHQAGSGVLTVQLLEGGPEKLDLPAGAVESSFLEYLWQLVHSVAGHVPDRQQAFMERNVRRFTGSSGGRGRGKEEDEGVGTVAAMEGVTIVNGLECKLSCVTSKVSYVLDTEDWLHRTRTQSRRRHVTGGAHSLVSRSRKAAMRSRRYQQWLNSGGSGPSGVFP